MGLTPDGFHEEVHGWEQVMARLRAEWEILRGVTQAGDEALNETLFKEKP